MKIVLVHNFYDPRYPSGENAVVERDLRMLRDAGHSVELVRFDSNELRDMSPIRRASVATWPLRGTQIDRLRGVASSADIVHFHNIYPAFGARALRVARASDSAAVITLHNYRYGCPSGMQLRDGALCCDCIGRKIALPSVQHGCYRGSRLQSIPIALAQGAFMEELRNLAAVVVLNDRMRVQMETLGVAPRRIFQMPTRSASFLRENVLPQRQIVFSGRLEEPKGVRDLIRAFRQSRISDYSWTLVIAGDGPLFEQLASEHRNSDTVRVVGRLSQEALARLYSESACMIVPSRWPEGFPTVISEALSAGLPVAVSERVAAAGAVEAAGGFVFTDEDMGGFLRTLPDRDLERAKMRARNYWLRELDVMQSLETLTSIYGRAMSDCL